nr:phospholipase-like protein [Tanacetum cinerariifolium]
MVEWAEQEHFKDEETKLSCPKINLSMVVKSNKGSSDKSFQSLIYLHEMQIRKQKIEEIKAVQHQDIKKHMEEFCLVSGLKFGVKNSTDYNKAKDPISFRRRVFSSDLDGIPIRGKDVLLLIESDVFKKLDDNDVVSLCCVCILQLVLLGVEDRRHVPNWILRLANDRLSWDNYPWGSYVWPTLYKHLRDANVKRWQLLYPVVLQMKLTRKVIQLKVLLGCSREATDDYYTRYRRHPRIVAWSSKHKFYRNMLKPMLHVSQLPVEGLVSDETEARSRWIFWREYLAGLICGLSIAKRKVNHREEEDQEGNDSSENGTLTYHVLATYGLFLSSVATFDMSIIQEDQEGNDSSKNETLTCHVLATYGLFLTSVATFDMSIIR